MNKLQRVARRALAPAGVIALLTLAIYLTAGYSYTLFHSIVEIFSVVIAFGVFTLAWNSRRLLDNDYILFLGIAYASVAVLDVFHTLAYKGVSVFPGITANEPTQLWIASRYILAGSLLIAPIYLRRRLPPYTALAVYAIVTTLVVLSVFHWRNFPTAYVDGAGLTAFKVLSEYLISAMLLGACALLVRYRAYFDAGVLRWLLLSQGLAIAAELAFTSYFGVYDLANLIGHLLKTGSYYFLFRAIIETGLVRPFDLLFRDLKQGEAALRASESRYRLLMEEASDGIWTFDSQGSYLEANKAACALVGYSADELLHMNVRDLTASEDLPDLEDAIAQMLHGQTIRAERRLLRKDGRVITIENASRQLDDGRIQSIIRDVTERKEAEAERERLLRNLQRSEAELSSVFAANANGVVVYDTTGRIVRMNEAAMQLLGYSPTAFDQPLDVRTRALTLLQPDGSPFPLSRSPHLDALQGQTVTGILVAIQRTGGRKTWLSLSAAPMHGPDGQITGAVTSMLDVTGPQDLREEREDLIRAVSHDLRNPLTVVQGHAQILAHAAGSGDPGERLRRHASAIMVSVQRMNSMIQTLVDSVRLRDQQLTPECGPLELGPFVGDLLQRLAAGMQTERVRVVDDGAVVAWADAGFVERILINLLSNAFKYSLPETAVTLTIRRVDSEAVISVNDQGVGISPEDLPHLFDRYFRARRSHAAAGLGLGLYTTRMLTEAMAGRIWVDTQQEAGSTFHVALPLAKEPALREKAP